MVTVVVTLALAGCAPLAPSTVTPHGAVTDAELRADPPECVVVLPAEVAPEVGLAAAEAESALARHLSGRVERVIGPGRREALARRLALDLGRADDRQRFAELTGCRHAAVSRFWGGRAWGVVWSETQVGLDVGLLTLAEGHSLWQRRHVARRGEGGLPLSPLSAVMATGLAAQAALDRDILLSVLDDVLRAVLRDLPDARDPQGLASRNSSVRPLSSRK